jgi:stage II sporulation protein D
VIRIRRTIVGLMLFALATGLLPAAVAQEGPASELRLLPQDGGRVLYRGGSYAGELSIVARPGGLGLIERQSVDGYLSGIREVPFSWPPAALEAQAIAARTYLAWTLQRGRSTAGRGYGFDICASTRCQVYRGAGVVDGEHGERWLDALVVTEGRILIFGETPAQALYSASHGTLSRGVEEIWGGDGLPYLIRVSSPEAGISPFDSWRLEMPMEIFVQVLRIGGVSVGTDVTDVSVSAEEGSQSTMRIASAAGITTLPLTRIRAIFNIHGPQLFPGLFPGDRNDGRRLPQSIPSYSFTTEVTAEPDPIRGHELLAPGELPEAGTVVVTGGGWGHGVGMSQWGAFAMAEDGATAEAILGHYYGGLSPTPAGPHLPEELSVGLTWDQDEIEFEVVGTVAFEVGDQPSALLTAGKWRATLVDGGVRIARIGPEIVFWPRGGQPW